MIKVSIILPTYNQQELLKRCLDSIPCRDDIEVVITNDGSTDNTLDILDNYNRLNLKVYTTVNRGPGPARNNCIDNSSGMYIMYVDDDDYLYTDEFVNLLNNLDNYFDYDIIKTLQEKNDGETWISKWTLRGCLVKRSFLGDIRHDSTLADDEHIMRQLEAKNPKIAIRDSKSLYHYNYPREGSVFWRAKQEKNKHGK